MTEPVAWRTRGMGLHDWDEHWMMCDEKKAKILLSDSSYRNGRRQVEPLFSAAAAPLPDVSDIVEAFRIAGPIALADFKSHSFILNDKEEAAVALITAALAQIGAKP